VIDWTVGGPIFSRGGETLAITMASPTVAPVRSRGTSVIRAPVLRVGIARGRVVGQRLVDGAAGEQDREADGERLDAPTAADSARGREADDLPLRAGPVAQRRPRVALRVESSRVLEDEHDRMARRRLGEVRVRRDGRDPAVTRCRQRRPLVRGRVPHVERVEVADEADVAVAVAFDRQV
jgi:hypothetical protein